MDQPGWDDEVDYESDMAIGVINEEEEGHHEQTSEQRLEQNGVIHEEIKKSDIIISPSGETMIENSDSDLGDSDDDDQARNGRYFLEKQSGPKCFNCGNRGHIVKDCPEASSLPCYLCGGTDHQRNGCPEEVCYNCMKIGHTSRDCPLPRKRRMYQNDLCNRCNYPGHLQKDCSLQWRKYNFIREVTRHEINRAHGFVAKMCYNCSSASHFGDECPYRRNVEYSIFHMPELEFLQLANLKATPKKNHEESKREGKNDRERDGSHTRHHEGTFSSSSRRIPPPQSYRLNTVSGQSVSRHSQGSNKRHAGGLPSRYDFQSRENVSRNWRNHQAASPSAASRSHSRSGDRFSYNSSRITSTTSSTYNRAPSKDRERESYRR